MKWIIDNYTTCIKICQKIHYPDNENAIVPLLI